MAKRFVLNETSYHGKGAINEIATEIKARGFKKAFVCSDPDLIKFNVTKKVLDVLDNAGIDYEVYSNIKPNPTIENVQTGVKAFEESGADVTEVYFNRLSEKTIDDYVKSGLGLDKAGGYGIQDGFNLVEKINGSYSNVVGFPQEVFKELFKKHNIV